MARPGGSRPSGTVNPPDQRVHTAGIEAATGPFLDLDRALALEGPQPSAPAVSRRRGLPLSLLLSLALHLSPLLLLLPWRAAHVEVPPPIPVQLVIEQPPPPPPVARVETVTKPPQGRLASEEVGEKVEKPNEPAVAPPPDTPSDPDPDQQADVQAEPESKQAASPIQPQPEPEEPSHQAKARPEPELRQAANFVLPLHEPTLLDREALALPAPDVEPLPERPVAPVSSRQAAPGPTARPRPPQHAAAVIGPPAARDEYLARLVTLVRPYLRLLSPEIVNGRRGTTSLAIRVLGDGTIARIGVSQSSGYPDIDTRVMQIVAAVGRFPPLPPWIDQPSWDINFHLRFPFPTGASGRP
jgi:TonB family protein